MSLGHDRSFDLALGACYETDTEAFRVSQGPLTGLLKGGDETQEKKWYYSKIWSRLIVEVQRQM